MELLTVVVLRSAERVLAIGVGCLLAFLGYRLFITVPTAQDGEGRFTLPSGAGIHLTRVGPGVFFSLFGTAIVALSFLKPVDYRQSLSIPDDKGGQTSAQSYSGVAAQGSGTDPEEIKRLRAQALGDMYVLNMFYKSLQPGLSDAQRLDLEGTLLRTKLLIIKSVWDEAWGDYVLFETWTLQTQGTTPPPPELAKAAVVFQRGLGEID